MKCYTVYSTSTLPYIWTDPTGDRVSIGPSNNRKTIFLSDRNRPTVTLGAHDSPVITGVDIAEVDGQLVFVNDKIVGRNDDRFLVQVTVDSIVTVKGGFKAVVDLSGDKLLIVQPDSVLEFERTMERLLIVTSKHSLVSIRPDELDAYRASLKLNEKTVTRYL